ncbi:MAG: metallophosphoesterase, partial [Chloroflexota bacterium]
MFKTDQNENQTFVLPTNIGGLEPQPDIFNRLSKRFGEGFLRERLLSQISHADKVFSRGARLMHIENSEWIMIMLYYGLKMMGVYKWGHRNFLDIQTVKNEVVIDRLPVGLDGYRILQLTDLHLDIESKLTPIIGELVQSIDYDLLVITGDYRASTSGSYLYALAETVRLMAYVDTPVYAILGNHDFIEFLPILEDQGGMTFLVNESLELAHNGETFYLIGIDDPHMYQTDNFSKAYADVPEEGFKILMSHSPETFKKAEAYKTHFLMAGHTHGGQICLPGGIPLIAHRGEATK